MVAEARERLPESPALRSQIFSARDSLEQAFEIKVDGFKERDIERRIPGAGSMPESIERELGNEGVLYSDTLVIRTSKSAGDYSTRTHEQRIVTRITPEGERTVTQIDVTYIGEPTDPYEIPEANQVGARIMQLEPDGLIHWDGEAIARMHALPELFPQ